MCVCECVKADSSKRAMLITLKVTWDLWVTAGEVPASMLFFRAGGKQRSLPEVPIGPAGTP